MIVGHQRTLAALTPTPPQVTLLLGPRSTGKTTLLNHVLGEIGIIAADRLHLDTLTAEAARECTRFLSTTPHGPAKAVTLRLDGASPQALNALLKTIEEPPERTLIMMTSSGPPLLTIASRARTFRSGYLPTDDLVAILESLGTDPAEAAKLARASNGTVASALTAAGALEAARPQVLTALRATAEGNEDLLANALTKWGDTEARLLLTWAHEVTTGLWRSFTPNDTYGLASSEVPRRITRAAATGARPKIAARLALATATEKRR